MRSLLLLGVFFSLALGGLRAALVEVPEVLEIPEGPATRADPPRLLVRHDLARLGSGGEIEERWYRQLRVGAGGEVGDLLELGFLGSQQDVEVLLARRLREVETVPLPWTWSAPDGEGRSRLDFDPGEARGGDLLEVLVRRRSRSALAGLDFAPAHSFGAHARVARDIFEVRVPEGASLRFLARGLGEASEPVRSSDSGESIYRWVVGPLAAADGPIRARPYVRTTRLQDWRQVADWYAPRLASRLVVTPSVAARARSLARGAANSRERVAAALAMVTFELPYFHRLQGDESDLVGHSAERVLETGKGNCVDKSNLLSALLGSLGVQAHPVLTAGTSTWPVDPEVPAFLPGDHALVRAEVEGGTLLLDPTEPGYRPGTLPPRLRGVVVWDPFTREFLATPQPQEGEDLLERSFEGAISPSGVMQGRMTILAEGEPAATLRRSLVRGRGGEKLLSFLLPPGARIARRQTGDPRDLSGPVRLCLDYRLDLPSLPGGEILLRPPFPPPARREAVEQGETSENPTDLRLVETASIQLPPGSKVGPIGEGESRSGSTSSLRVRWSQPSPDRVGYDSEYRRRGADPDPEVAQARRAWASRVVVLRPAESARLGLQP